MAGKYVWISLPLCTSLPFVVWKSGHVGFSVWHAVYMTQYHGKRHQISEQHRSSLEALIPQFEGRNLLSCVIDFTLMLSMLALSMIWLSRPTSPHVTLADKLILYAIPVCIYIVGL